MRCIIIPVHFAGTAELIGIIIPILNEGDTLPGLISYLRRVL